MASFKRRKPKELLQQLPVLDAKHASMNQNLKILTWQFPYTGDRSRILQAADRMQRSVDQVSKKASSGNKDVGSQAFLHPPNMRLSAKRCAKAAFF
jgi:hypothetical protein